MSEERRNQGQRGKYVPSEGSDEEVSSQDMEDVLSAPPGDESSRRSKPRASSVYALNGVGSLIGIIVGGAYAGVAGAMIGGVAGGLLVSTGLQTQLEELRRQGKTLNLGPAIIALSYILGAVGAFVGLWLAQLLQQNGSGHEGQQHVDWLIALALPAFAGGLAALIPVLVASGKD